MRATVVLQGGGPFTANDDLDRRLLSQAGVQRVVVLPTADAFEHPERLIGAAMSWGERMGVEVEALMVLNRRDALDAGAAGVIGGAEAVYVVGDQPLHLRSVLKDTPVWSALTDLAERDALLVAVAGSADGLCDPMVDPRGGAFTLGLGLVAGVALVTAAETWSPERLQRTLDLADTTVVSLPTGAALIRQADGWEQVGDVVVHGDLPDARSTTR